MLEKSTTNKNMYLKIRFFESRGPHHRWAIKIWVILLILFVIGSISISFANDSRQKAIDYIKMGKIVHQGISATYVEVCTAFVVSHYIDAKFTGWDCRPDPKNPVANLVALKFSTKEARKDVLKTKTSGARKNIRNGVPSLEIIWRVNDLIGLKITPYNFYAQEALRTYRDMVGSLHELAE